MPPASADTWFLERVQSEQARLRSYIRALGVRAEAVDDLAQETLIIALKKLDEFDRGGDFGVWVRQIARRLIANERRKEARRSQILSDCVTDLLLEINHEPMSPRERQEHDEELAAAAGVHGRGCRSTAASCCSSALRGPQPGDHRQPHGAPVEPGPAGAPAAATGAAGVHRASDRHLSGVRRPCQNPTDD